ncbi:hypothetical protein [Ascidiaceihabitans sp.]|uniref:hypothetical protein n=1 Tax=Ascidiaceihabitans sp. TaxID=1872644 RepID=UPI0032975C0F
MARIALGSGGLDFDPFHPAFGLACPLLGLPVWRHGKGQFPTTPIPFSKRATPDRTCGNQTKPKEFAFCDDDKDRDKKRSA